MAKIIGIEGLQTADINNELRKGAKFVIYKYCISLVFITFNHRSEVHFIKSGESQIQKGLPYSVISFLAGWWGFPWGPVHTVGALITNFKGGEDLTVDIVKASKTLHLN